MIRVGIAGIGYIAEEYIKLFSQGKIKNAELHALSSRNYAHMEEIKNTYHLTDATLFSDYNAMLASSGIDMVIVCTPHFCHPDMAIRSIERGIHTLIEKPVGVFPEELETLRLCCARHPDIRSGVLYCRRGNKAFIKLKELTDSGFIGEMKRVTWIVTDMCRPKAYFDAYPWKGTFREEGGGLLMTQVSHQIDLLVWLCGLPSALQAFCSIGRERDIKVENEATVVMEYPRGATGQFVASSRECPGSNRLEIIGSHGQAVLENYSILTLRSLQQDEKDYSLQSSEPYGRIPYTEQLFTFKNEENSILQAGIINNFISAITKNEPVLCPVQQALDTQIFIQTAYLSAWKQKMTTLPPDTTIFTRELLKRMKNRNC